MVNRIVIDAGHNGLTDPGAVYNGRRESDDTPVSYTHLTLPTNSLV